MKQLLILGAGTAGTMMANHLHRTLNTQEWEINIIDEREEHYYQPGYLFLPFDIYQPEDIVKPVKKFIPKGVNLITGKIDRIVPEADFVSMANGQHIPYNILIIATGSQIAPEEVEGMKGAAWQKTVFD